MSRGGLLIVNADDWGNKEKTTAAIADCFQTGSVTSTTALMFMPASKFGANIARELPELGVGLHLNFSLEYSEHNVPPPVLARQRRVIDYVARQSFRRWEYSRRMRKAIDTVIADQLECFVDLYGEPPTHIDGHHHLHLIANVMRSEVIPPGMKIRNLLVGAELPGQIAEMIGQFPCPQFFFSFSDVWTEAQNGPSTWKLEVARTASAEVMVHPGLPHEYTSLQSEKWLAALRGFRTGTFNDL